MKTRLLLAFCLFSSFLGFSQITYSNFWNTATTTSSTVVAAYATYTCNSNATFYLDYSTDSNFSRGNVTTIPLGAFSSGDPMSHTITGLSSNTLYYWRLSAVFTDNTCSYNGSPISEVQSFRTNAPTPNLELANYTFNNTLNDSNGNNPFGQNTYVADRDNNANAALSITQGTSASIPTLPMGSSTRSIALWYKVAANVASNTTLFYYGGSKANAYVSLQIGVNGNPLFNGVNLGGTYAAGVWRQIVFTYDGTNVKIYMNGVLFSTQVIALDTSAPLNGNLSFVLGSGQTTTTVDDLKIYNYALSQTEVTNLHSLPNTLSTQDYTSEQAKLTLYPNPVSDILNIDSATGVKSVSIFGLLGNKVIESTSNPINVSALAKGIYVVQVTDASGKVTTQKVVKK